MYVPRGGCEPSSSNSNSSALAGVFCEPGGPAAGCEPSSSSKSKPAAPDCGTAVRAARLASFAPNVRTFVPAAAPDQPAAPHDAGPPPPRAAGRSAGPGASVVIVGGISG